MRRRCVRTSHRPAAVVAAVGLLLGGACAVGRAQATAPADGAMDFGTAGLTFPPAQVVSGHVPRTAELLGEAYRRRDPVVATRVRLVCELGTTGIPAAAPYVGEAMSDPAAAVRAEAARAAAAVGEASLLVGVEGLLKDADAEVRREAVVAACALARMNHRATAAVETGLGDRDPNVVAAAVRSAYLPAHAALVTRRLPELPAELKAEAA